MMNLEKNTLDERTLRDVPVIIYLLLKPTGNPEKDAENAISAEEHIAGMKNGTVVGFIDDCAPGVLEARRALGQIN